VGVRFLKKAGQNIGKIRCFLDSAGMFDIKQNSKFFSLGPGDRETLRLQ
jgi:hypothetical protein